jgi:hypothetical protein
MLDFETRQGAGLKAHLVVDERDQVVAVVPLFLRQRKLARVFTFRDYVSGTSLRGGPLPDAGFSERQLKGFWREWLEWLQTEATRDRVDEIRVALPHHAGSRPVTDLYPYHPLRELGFTETSNLTLVLDLDRDADALWKAVDSGCRNMVRRAEKAGAEAVRIDERRTWIEDAYAVNRETFAERGVSAFTRETLELIWDRFVAAGHAHVFGARHEGRWISFALTVGTPQVQYYWMGFSRRPRPLPGSSNLVLWRALDDLRQRGVKVFELGSLDFGDPNMEAVSRFKQSFGGRPRHSMDAVLVRKPLKHATAQWLMAFAQSLQRRRPRSAAGGDGRAGGQ